MNHQGLDVYYFLFGFLHLGSKMSAMDNNQRSVKLTCIVLLPAGEITVPVSNKIEGILNKHWHTFLNRG